MILSLLAKSVQSRACNIIFLSLLAKSVQSRACNIIFFVSRIGLDVPI